MVKEAELQLQEQVPALSQLVEGLIKSQAETDQVFASISNRVMEVFNNPDEIKLMQHKDLLKLLEVSQKQRLQPIETLTKLLQAITALQEKSNVTKKSEILQDVINEFTSTKKNKNIDYVEAVEEVVVEGLDIE